MRELRGRSLVSRALDFAESCELDATVLTSDDDEILAASGGTLAIRCKRPSELASDTAGDFDTLKHALEYAEGVSGSKFDLIAFLRPTSYLRALVDFKRAVNRLNSDKSCLSSVRTVTTSCYPPFWLKKNVDGCLEPLLRDWASHQYSRRQDLPQVFMCNGNVDLIKVENLFASGVGLYGEAVGWVASLNDMCVDLDTEADFVLAEQLMEYFER